MKMRISSIYLLLFPICGLAHTALLPDSQVPLTGINSVPGDASDDNAISSSYSLCKKISDGSKQCHVAIVGMGPRGTSVLERLYSAAPLFHKHSIKLVIHVIDSHEHGSGSVWKESSELLLMNTMTAQMTMYTDESVNCSGPITPGLNLFQWGVHHGLAWGPIDYATRNQFGKYLKWVYKDVKKKSALYNILIQEHNALAVGLHDSQDDTQTLILDNGTNEEELSGLAAVVFAQGHLPLDLGQQEDNRTNHANAHSLRYIPAGNAGSIDLSTITPQEPIFLEGLGLAFFDYLALLSTGLGGHFTPSPNGTLSYTPSGREPRIYAGSRRGVPSNSKGDNTKKPGYRYTPALLNKAEVARLQNRDKGTLDFERELLPLIKKEVEIVYYETLFKRNKTPKPGFRLRFLSDPYNPDQDVQILNDYHITEEDRWSWNVIEKPYGTNSYDALAWRDWLLNYLRHDAVESKIGIVESPVKAAQDAMRSLVETIGSIIDHGALSGPSREKHLDRYYTPLNTFLAIGPPRHRIEQTIALMEAGILDIIGPKPKVYPVEGAWHVNSSVVSNYTVRVTTLIEARLQATNINRTTDKLLRDLLSSGHCRLHSLGSYTTGALDITQSPFRMINKTGDIHLRRFAIGIPTEGVHWSTSYAGYSNTNAIFFRQTDAIAQAILHLFVD